MRRRLAMFEAHIALRRSAGFEAARADFLAAGSGKAMMDSVRRVVATIEADEHRLLAQRTDSQKRYASTVSWIVGAGAVVAALLALAISLMLSRGAETEARLASELRTRADEVEAVNSQLQGQATNMEILNEELRTTNEQLEARTAEAEEANQVKADFLANMSHDLRTPLNAIIGYVDLLEGGVRGTLSADQHHDVVRIKRGATHLLALVNEVLDFAKVESGQLQLHIGEISIERVLAELRPLVEPQMAAKGLEFATSSDGGLVVRADREKLDQIFVNLVSNAIQFTSTGGRVAVVCRADGLWMQADVADTGEGIAADHLDAIFAPFVQLDGGRRREARGVGLGLAISRHLARAMGGELTVTSVVGKGSTFTLRLPLASDQNTALHG